MWQKTNKEKNNRRNTWGQTVFLKSSCQAITGYCSYTDADSLFGEGVARLNLSHSLNNAL